MLDLAMHGGKRPVTRTQSTAPVSRFLSRDCSALRHTRVACAARAAALARELAKVSVADIITAVDGPLDATQCGGKENCKDERRCMTHDLWATLNDKMYEYLDSVKLSDLVAQQATRKESVVLQDKRAKEAAVSA
jgi:Rrf2 family iron-sulfur cluster assembly transcriptional regulator